MHSVLEQIKSMRVVPVIALENSKDAEPLAEALINGGLACAEITFRTDAAADAIKIMANTNEIVLGAGTVLNVEQVKRAVDNGAQFIVSPGFNHKVVSYCVDNDIPVIPGVATPTEISQALEYHLDVVKFFPAEAFGGLTTLKAISAPFGRLQFIPTGGINADNLKDYLKFKKVIACGGSWMVRADLINSGQFREIERLVHQAVQLTKEIKI
jgi:2-dehydro-3-deoxyphosphogluconate aldolase / (4S)-4-hydroxy-2-oxoglutarate aldolase